MGIYRDNIRNNIVKYRKQLGLKQSELAEKLGISTTAVSGWERGAAAPDIETLIEICKIFKISLAEMYGIGQNQLSYTETMMLDKYRKLDTISQDIINYIIDAELSRITDNDYVFNAAARGNSKIDVTLNKKDIEKDLNKPMSKGFDE